MKYNISFILPLLLSLLQFSGLHAAPDRAKQDYEKKYSETYNVDGRGSVRLENRYGRIDVQTWDRDQVQIDVTIRANTTTQEKANDIFDRITIDFTGGGNRATATTSIGANKKGGFWDSLFGDSFSISFGDNGNDFKVIYIVKMPAAAQLETVAKYCDVSLPDLSGSNVTDVAYGDMVAGKLSGSNNVSISYGSLRAKELGRSSELRLRYSEATVRQADDLRYDGRYSETEIDMVNTLRIDAGYEDIEVQSAKKIVADGNYNDIEVGTVDDIEFDGNYTGYSIDLVNVRIRGESRYGDVEVDELGPNFNSVHIRTSYADVEIGVPGGRGYEVDLSTRYGDISLSGDGQLNRTNEGSSESIKGTIAGTGTGRIDISTSYGDVSLR